jgi:hypothetical protein
MRYSAGSCASIRALRCQPLRESDSHPVAVNGSRPVSKSDPSSKAGRPYVGNDQLIAMRNWCAQQPRLAG